MAELSALLHMDGTYTIRSGSRHLLVTDSSSVNTVKKTYTLIHSLFNVETPLIRVRTRSPRHQNIYRLEIADQPGFFQMLNEIGVLDSSLSPEPTIPARLTRKGCCCSSSLRGAFLGGGYVSEPYGPADLEIACSTAEFARTLMVLMSSKSIEAGMRMRRGQYVVYLKKRQEISYLLAVIGAHNEHLEWESQTIINTTKNQVNRVVNCDAANAKRLAEASIRQREAIAELEQRGLLDDADVGLSEIARARLEHPNASLAELGRMIDPSISKSSVQSRLRRLERMLE